MAKQLLCLNAGLSFRKFGKVLISSYPTWQVVLYPTSIFDHAKSVKDILAAGLDCYMSSGTAQALQLSGHRLHTVPALKQFRVGTFTVLPFPVQHDAQEPFGFLIQSDAGEKLLFITDTFYCRFRLKDIDIIAIECNYRREILDENIASGLVPASIRNRIIKSHFEIENVKAFLGACGLSRCREIHLIHISSTNGDPEGFVDEIQAMTGIPTYTNGAS